MIGASGCARSARTRSARRRAARSRKKKLDKLLVEGDPEAAGVIQGAIEDFAQELATVIRRFLRLKGWRDTERIVVGGGLRESRIGELAIGRAAVLLKAAGVDVELVPIRHHPDEAGLIGAVHLAPAWIFSGHDCLVGGRHRRLQHPRRHRPDEPEEDAGPFEGRSHGSSTSGAIATTTRRRRAPTPWSASPRW